MTQRERQGWLIVASLFVTLLLVFGGGYNTVPIFLPALLKGFPQWSRAQVSFVPSVLALSAGVSVVPVGWLLDRIEARIVMVGGALSVGGGFLIASRVHSLTPMLCAYLLVGVGIAAGTVLPGAFVISNWFKQRRGLAMGLALSGSTAGGMTMTLVVNYVVQRWGWRAAYLTLGTPMIVVVVPLLIIMIRSRPPGAVKLTVAQTAETLEGFEMGAALRTRSFWLIAVANFCFGFAAAGSGIHMVAYFDGLGYRHSSAALAMSLIYGFAGIGKIAMGMFSDRASARSALGATFVMQGATFMLAFIAMRESAFVMFVVVYGLSLGAPLMLLPLLVAESMGLKRYGSIGGLLGITQTLGAALGPVVAGWMFDASKSYFGAFELFMAINFLGAIASFACLPYAAERSRQVLPAASPVSA